jgi:hypothetical protein
MKIRLQPGKTCRQEILSKRFFLNFGKSDEEEFHKGLLGIRQVTRTHRQPGSLFYSNNLFDNLGDLFDKNFLSRGCSPLKSRILCFVGWAGNREIFA